MTASVLVEEKIRSGERGRLCALAIIDLYDLKNVNETVDYSVADGLIYAVAERLAMFASDTVKISRFGGDEFMIYFDTFDDESHIRIMIDRIFVEMQGDVDVSGHMLRIQASGSAVLGSARDSDVDTIIVKVDLALYKAKESRKNGWHLFEAVMVRLSSTVSR